MAKYHEHLKMHTQLVNSVNQPFYNDSCVSGDSKFKVYTAVRHTSHFSDKIVLFRLLVCVFTLENINLRRLPLSCLFPVNQRGFLQTYAAQNDRSTRIVSWMLCFFLSPFWTSSSRPRRISGVLCSSTSTSDPYRSIFLNISFQLDCFTASQAES